MVFGILVYLLGRWLHWGTTTTVVVGLVSFFAFVGWMFWYDHKREKEGRPVGKVWIAVTMALVFFPGMG